MGAGAARTTRANVAIHPRWAWYGPVGPGAVARVAEGTVVGGEILDDLVIADDCPDDLNCPRRGGAGAR